jgi:hypothetical protein
VISLPRRHQLLVLVLLRATIKIHSTSSGCRCCLRCLRCRSGGGVCFPSHLSSVSFDATGTYELVTQVFNDASCATSQEIYRTSEKGMHLTQYSHRCGRAIHLNIATCSSLAIQARSNSETVPTSSDSGRSITLPRREACKCSRRTMPPLSTSSSHADSLRSSRSMCCRTSRLSPAPN